MYNRSHAAQRLATVLLALISTASASIWTFHLEYGPAPPPDQGPPFSKDASRNPALLKYQIIGICGGYVGFVLILGFLVLTVGRRLRKAAQQASIDLAQEMVKPGRAVDFSPASSQQPWSSPKSTMHGFERKDDKKDDSKVSVSSIPSANFDPGVMERDRIKRQEEMERLYAAVMGAETTHPSEQELPQVPKSPEHVRKISSSSFSQRHPPSRSNTSGSSSASQAPAPRKDIRAIYPPDRPLPSIPVSPRSPIHSEQITTWQNVQPTSPHSPASSFRGKQRSNRKTFRGVNISAPIQRYPASNDEFDDIDASTPLTPRFYNPGPPPSPPMRSPPYDDDGNESDIMDDVDQEDLDEPRPIPNPAPQRSFSYRSDASTLHNNNDFSPNRTNSSNDLPLRGLTNNTYLTPASPRMQTTVIEQRHHYHPHGPPNGMWSVGSPGGPNGLWSAGLGVPRTAGLMPHSPYMPFSPVTPVTPHLQTKSERKQRNKERVRRAITQEDGMVKDEKEMWGDAY